MLSLRETVTKQFDKEDDEVIRGINAIGSNQKITVIVRVEGKLVEFEYDTAAGVSVIPLRIWKKLCSKTLRKGLRLRTYNGNHIDTLGTRFVSVGWAAENSRSRAQLGTIGHRGNEEIAIDTKTISIEDDQKLMTSEEPRQEELMTDMKTI
ncbi:hypothetical protein ACOME3_005211 [Neoechinorhynchus agilis]